MNAAESEKASDNKIDNKKRIEFDQVFTGDRSIKPSTFSDVVQQNKTKLNSTANHQNTFNEETDTYHKTKNTTEEALRNNQWSYGIVTNKEPSPEEYNKENSMTTRYPWQGQPKPAKSSFPRNFAYHRVTGNPLYHNNLNNNPKAYIAVSVIAPKPINDRPTDDELILENELRELKPWTHNQNLKNMASIRSRWVIQSDKEKAAYTP
ncbi:hypothetical protein MML48_2g00014078 [Holotrichia oblita]|uniref:Uncharacterized protein n=2 Tax=Holotrichia oblita TaxID=644536 RepID=A0ACB9TP94_HOLOL|nr:hypothetical protein MML48_2g00000769 [Holotrichia oblita]KAI4468604.1 hypothetical protein MML48_2g00014078 [Holotrichia oblita]